MSNITTKKIQALKACEKVNNGIEDGCLAVFIGAFVVQKDCTPCKGPRRDRMVKL